MIVLQPNYRARSALIFLLFCSLYAIIIVNLYSIQIKQRDFYAHLGNKQYNVTITQRPPRALILDRNGTPLALNKDALSAFIMPKLLQSPETLKPFLQKHYPKAYKRLLHKPDAHFLFVKRNLTPNELQDITNSAIDDIHIVREPNRYYPLKAAGPVIGLTDIDNNGLFGIELMYDAQLAGTPITYILEKDARSGHFYFDKQIKSEGLEGTPIKLTIDRDVQFLAYEAVKDAVQKHGAQSGAALIMNPVNGHIIAAVQYPSFDPGNTKDLNLENTKLRIITDTYELGSVIKTFLALAALQEGVVSPEEEIDCEGLRTTYINGLKINTVFPNDKIPFSHVIRKSNNIGVAKIGLRLQDKLYDHYRRLGFGTKTGIHFHGEQSGFINPPANWSKRSILSLSFGYEITANLLQLAQAFGVIANDGVMVKPKLVATALLNPSIQFASQITQGERFVKTPKKEKQPTAHLKRPSFYQKKSVSKEQLNCEPLTLSDSHRQLYRRVNERLIYSPTVIAQIRDILKQTAAWTTRRLQHIPGLTVMGKTGTANLVIDGQYDPNKNIYTFAGIIEKGSYKRVIVTFINQVDTKGLLAAQVAAPLFVTIAQQVVIHDGMT